MTSFEDFYKHLLQFDKNCIVEGEIAGRTVYVLHIHESNAERTIKTLKDTYGARIFDIVKPSDTLAPSDEELDKLSSEQRKMWEKSSHRWAFRTYIPPAGDERMLITSEVLEKFIAELNEALKYDELALSRLLMTNFPCNLVLAENHKTIKCNAIWDSKLGGTPSVSCWGVLNGLIEAVTGERLTFKTKYDQPDLRDIAEGKDPIVKVLRKTH